VRLPDRELASLRGRPSRPGLLLDPLERRVDPRRGAAGASDAIQLHLVDALPDDDHRNRGGEAPLKLERCRVRRMRCDADRVITSPIRVTVTRRRVAGPACRVRDGLRHELAHLEPAGPDPCSSVACRGHRRVEREQGARRSCREGGGPRPHDRDRDEHAERHATTHPSLAPGSRGCRQQCGDPQSCLRFDSSCSASHPGAAILPSASTAEPSVEPPRYGRR
jgi:hypothetical protein